MLLTSSTLPFAHSRGFICLLPGVTPVALRDVGACATLPCPLQDWALHGKNHAAAAARSEGISGGFVSVTHLIDYRQFRCSLIVRCCIL